MSRKSNVELAANFRFLLTNGAKTALTPELLEVTKPWRNELWRAFHEIQDRLDPIGSMERQKEYLNKMKNKHEHAANCECAECWRIMEGNSK